MTTIAFRDGVMAADTQAEAGGWILPGITGKLRRVNSVAIIGVTGDFECLEAWLEWYSGARSAPYDLGEHGRIILAHATDGLTVYEGAGWFRVEAPFMAFGSGSPAAIAAMHMGADAARAIEIAMLLDPSTGGEVQTMSVREVAVRAA